MRCAEHVARMGNMRKNNKILGEHCERKRAPGCSWDDNINWNSGQNS